MFQLLLENKKSGMLFLQLRTSVTWHDCFNQLRLATLRKQIILLLKGLQSQKFIAEIHVCCKLDTAFSITSSFQRGGTHWSQQWDRRTGRTTLAPKSPVQSIISAHIPQAKASHTARPHINDVGKFNSPKGWVGTIENKNTIYHTNLVCNGPDMSKSRLFWEAWASE